MKDNLGKWNHAAGPARAFGPTETYKLAARWLAGLRVEDWGAGAGFARRYFRAGDYQAIDGSARPCRCRGRLGDLFQST